MVNTWTGEYKYDPNEPEETRCDMDRICDLITKTYGYQPHTITIEHMAERILSIMDEDIQSDDLYNKNGTINIDTASSWLYDNQPLSDFDYNS